MKHQISDNSASRRAFSLVEILVVIAVIGIIAALSIVMIGRIQGRSEEATAHRHAQLVAAIAGQAVHAGDTTLTGAGTKEDALKLLVVGVKGSGTFEDVVFRLELSDTEQAQTLPYLDYLDGLLVANTLN